MEKLENLLRFGHTIQMAGAIYSGEGKTYLVYFPEDGQDTYPLESIALSHEGWKDLIHQTDVLETEILQKAADGALVKVIARKGTRQIEQGVSWNVYRRDKYRCRYCAKDTVPLTVDHLVLWEEGGPSIEANLVAACRKCNKIRGNTQYEDWLKSSYYLDVSTKLPMAAILANESLIQTLAKIPRRIQQRAR
jgi:hypothetical protein